MPPSTTHSHPCTDEAATIAAGESLARSLSAGDIVTLTGDLGAGKTHFTKGLARGLGFAGDVTSPTFSLVQEYRGGRIDLIHFDFYRLDSPGDLDEIGWDDYLDGGDAVLAIEWPDRFPGLVPDDLIAAAVELLHLPGSGGRELKITTPQNTA